MQLLTDSHLEVEVAELPVLVGVFSSTILGQQDFGCSAWRPSLAYMLHMCFKVALCPKHAVAPVLVVLQAHRIPSWAGLHWRSPEWHQLASLWPPGMLGPC